MMLPAASSGPGVLFPWNPVSSSPAAASVLRLMAVPAMTFSMSAFIVSASWPSGVQRSDGRRRQLDCCGYSIKLRAIAPMCRAPSSFTFPCLSSLGRPPVSASSSAGPPQAWRLQGPWALAASVPRPLRRSPAWETPSPPAGLPSSPGSFPRGSRRPARRY